MDRLEFDLIMEAREDFSKEFGKRVSVLGYDFSCGPTMVGDSYVLGAIISNCKSDGFPS